MRYIIGFLISIGLIILLFVWIFGGNDDPAPRGPQLIEYADTTTVMQYTEDYRVNYKDDHRQLVITVGKDSIVFTAHRGYQGEVLRTRTYDNSQASYETFLRSLQLAGYTRGNKDESLRDERGYCPEGRRYIFEIQDGSRVMQHLWDTSCRGLGTFDGKTGTVRDLFRRQVPDYRELSSGLSLF